MLLSLRAYAKHRGTWLITVQRAIAAGIIEKNPDGKVDTEVQDARWDRWQSEHRAPAGTPLLDTVPALDMSKEFEVVARVEGPELLRPGAPDVPKAEERISETEARRRKECALAKLRELEVAEKEGKLVDAGQVRDTWVAITGKFRDALLRLPDKAAPSYHAAGSVQEARKVLLSEVQAILRTLGEELTA